MNRGLTKEEAEAGVIPQPLSKDEWRDMADTSLIATAEAMRMSNIKFHTILDRKRAAALMIELSGRKLIGED